MHSSCLPAHDLLIKAGWGRNTFAVHNPATGEVVANAADMSEEAIVAIIDCAAAAQKDWASRTAKERGVILNRWFRLIEARTDDLAALITIEQGKPLAEARGEVLYGASFVEWFAEEGKRVYGEVIPSHGVDKRLLTLRQPVGVVAAITPWNFPLAMITRKVAPALAAGCAIVVKPAEATPLTAYALCELARQAGLPAGLFSVVTARDPTAVGRIFTDSLMIRKLSFTGSTAVGKMLMAQCAGTVKRMSLELGGNAPFIVFADADLDRAVSGAIAAKFRNAGQTCVCANRLLVEDSIHDAFVAKLAERVAKMKVGPGRDEGVTIGPLIDDRAVDKVERLVADAIARGGRIATGGARHALAGNFFEPTVIANATSAMGCANEEIFGPVAPIFRFRDEAEAISLANSSRSGLAAYFYARDIGRVWRVAEALEFGMIGINEGLISTEVAPFGGIKESGLGREGARQGIEEYLDIKYLCMGLGE